MNTRFVEALRLDSGITIEVDARWELHCVQQQFAIFRRRLLQSAKRVAQWGLGLTLIGGLAAMGAYAFPAAALLGLALGVVHG